LSPASAAVELLVEHLDTGDGGLHGRILSCRPTMSISVTLQRQRTALNTTRHNRTTTLNAEDVLNRHQEGLVGVTLRGGNPLVNSSHQLNESERTPVQIGLRWRSRSRPGTEPLE
jgi:hypothetical protein